MDYVISVDAVVKVVEIVLTVLAALGVVTLKERKAREETRCDIENLIEDIRTLYTEYLNLRNALPREVDLGDDTI